MDEGFNNIEDLLKGTLDGYKKQPSPKVWKAVSLKLFFRSSLFYASVFILLVGIGIGGYFYFTANDAEQKVNSNNAGQEINANSDIILKPTTKTDKLVSESNTLNKSLKSQNEEQIIPNNTKLKDKIENSEKISEVAPASEVLAKTQISNYPGLPGLNSDDNINPMTSVYPQFNYGVENTLPAYLNLTSAYSGFSIVPKDDYGRLEASFALGAFITPELIFLNDEDNSKKSAINIDVTGVYGNNLFFEAGIGVSISEDDGKYDIKYSQYDSIGYFYQVNSFTIDPASGQPVFKTTLEGLYDTINYNTSETVNNYYTYLRIPVYAGYKIREFKRLSIFLKAGGIYSVLVKSNEPGIDYTNDNATSIVIEDETPNRIHSYFKLSASLGLSYRLSNSFDLSVEPVYNYYMQPVYERRLTNKAPWSIGLRFGFLYKIK